LGTVFRSGLMDISMGVGDEIVPGEPRVGWIPLGDAARIRMSPLGATHSGKYASRRP
jgi:hypothetical protein